MEIRKWTISNGFQICLSPISLLCHKHCGITNILCCYVYLLLLIQNMDYRSINKLQMNTIQFRFLKKIIFQLCAWMFRMRVPNKSKFFKLAFTGNWPVPIEWSKKEPEHFWFNSLILWFFRQNWIFLKEERQTIERREVNVDCVCVVDAWFSKI